jgi:hypothetical protein
MSEMGLISPFEFAARTLDDKVGRTDVHRNVSAYAGPCGSFI